MLYILNRVELPDDRNESFLGALRQNITSNTQLVMCVVPTNKKDRYDAIKKFTCVDHPGMFFLFKSDNLLFKVERNIVFTQYVWGNFVSRS